MTVIKEKKRYLKPVIIYLILCSVFSSEIFARKQDSLRNYSSGTPFTYRQLIVPVLCIGVGTLSLKQNWTGMPNQKIRSVLSRPGVPVRIDDYLQYMPVVLSYGLNALGVKSKNNLLDRTILLASSYLIMSVSVTAIKRVAGIRRPDVAVFNSFPSGHAATAFMGAEFLRMEYKDTNPWIGFAGYSMAILTGVLRIYNDRHWTTDVLAGAGIGILSTRISYWIFTDKNGLFKRKQKRNKVIMAAMPYYGKGAVGICGEIRF